MQLINMYNEAWIIVLDNNRLDNNAGRHGKDRAAPPTPIAPHVPLVLCTIQPSLWPNPQYISTERKESLERLLQLL